MFSTGGGLAPIAIQVYNRLALMVSEKSDRQYSSVINYIRCKLSFSLIRSTIRCLRGSRSIYHSAHRDSADLTLLLLCLLVVFVNFVCVHWYDFVLILLV